MIILIILFTMIVGTVFLLILTTILQIIWRLLFGEEGLIFAIIGTYFIFISYSVAYDIAIKIF